MGGAHIAVDVQTIGRAADAHHLGPELMQYGRRDLVGSAMGRIDHDLQTLEGQIAGKRGFAKLDVTAGGIVEAPRLAQVGRGGPLRRLVQGGLDLALPVVAEFAALGAEELDAVVLERVVAGADHHAQTGALGAREIGHAGRGQRPQQHDVNACRIETRLQRALEHVARYAGVLANEHQGPRLAAPQHPTNRMTESQNKVWRDRGLPDGAAYAVGAKVLSCHEMQ